MVDNQNKKKRILGVESNIFFVGLTSFLTDTTTKMVYSILPLFLTTLGASKMEISLIEGIAESTASVLKSLSGWWSDKIGRNKPFMIIGYGITALLSPLFAFVTTPLQVLSIRFVERVGKGIRTAPRDSLVAGSPVQRCNRKGCLLIEASPFCAWTWIIGRYSSFSSDGGSGRWINYPYSSFSSARYSKR